MEGPAERQSGVRGSEQGAGSTGGEAGSRTLQVHTSVRPKF